ncbi:DUF4912 domain-containing protein [Pseudalkalibacillus sp. SCS-8]|uniref:DUF4912 domain-containing protein n=1 Tax=Pseudalkalibacillus nanhaiensis TaxID=3115291 RepID=UPI0032DAA7BF
MIEEIIEMKKKGYTIKQISSELNVSVGKIQYRLRKERLTQPLAESETQFTISKKIPGAYEIDRIVVLPQNPHCLYAYWDVQTPTQHMVAHHFSKSWTALTKKLRIYDCSDVIFNGHNAHRYIDIPVPEMTNNWFIRDLEENRTYIADYGVADEGCDFFSIVRSKPVETPRIGDKHSSRHRDPVKRWQTGELSSPEWHETFSAYSIYNLLK